MSIKNKKRIRQVECHGGPLDGLKIAPPKCYPCPECAARIIVRTPSGRDFVYRARSRNLHIVDYVGPRIGPGVEAGR